MPLILNSMVTPPPPPMVSGCRKRLACCSWPGNISLEAYLRSRGNQLPPDEEGYANDAWCAQLRNVGPRMTRRSSLFFFVSLQIATLLLDHQNAALSVEKTILDMPDQLDSALVSYPRIISRRSPRMSHRIILSGVCVDTACARDL